MDLLSNGGSISAAPLLRMKQIGPLGTGKSAAVIAIVWFAHQHEVARWIGVTAYTHRAVINLMGDIGPTTAHMVFGTSSDLFKQGWGNDTPTRMTRAKLDLQETCKDIRLLIVDEMFTMTGKHFAAIEQQLFLTMRHCGRTPDSSHSLFGGIGVLLTGDHHHNRPVHGAPLF
jgi:hypothetical protein